MDTKTYVEISEAFAKLALDYQSDIKHASPGSVTTHLTQMAKDLSCLLSMIKVYEYIYIHIYTHTQIRGLSIK